MTLIEYLAYFLFSFILGYLIMSLALKDNQTIGIILLKEEKP